MASEERMQKFVGKTVESVSLVANTTEVKFEDGSIIEFGNQNAAVMIQEENPQVSED